MPNDDLTDDIWALKKALDFASEVFANSSDTPENKQADDDMLNRAYEAWDAIKSRLRI
jgi:hypothetical protein